MKLKLIFLCLLLLCGTALAADYGNIPMRAGANITGTATSHLFTWANGTGLQDPVMRSQMVAGDQVQLNKSAIVTSIASPGLDTNVPSEKAVRTALTSDGWITTGETWTYSSADAPVFVFNISGDMTTKYYPGYKISLTQTTEKFFIVVKAAYSSPNTMIFVYGGTDYTLANAAITSPYYSTSLAPARFPSDPSKWTVTFTDSTLRSQSSPTSTTWYNLGSSSITIPIGLWQVDYTCYGSFSISSAASMGVYTTLSTTSNSETDTDFRAVTYSDSDNVRGTQGRMKTLALTTKTVYYLNTMTGKSSTSAIANQNAIVPLTIRARCAYF